MKTKSNRRGRRQRGYRGLLWVLAAGLLLFGLIAQQNILLEAVAESKAAHKDYMTTYNEEALKDMQDNYGVTVSELEDGEFEKMREMSQPVYDMVEEYDPELYAQLMEEAEAANAAYPAA